MHDAVKRLLKEADCVGIIPDTEEKPEPLVEALHSAGVKGLRVNRISTSVSNR